MMNNIINSTITRYTMQVSNNEEFLYCASSPAIYVIPNNFPGTLIS